MCTVRHTGRFVPDDPLDVPCSVVEHLAAQLGVETPSVMKRYTERPKTAYEHAWEIWNAYEFTSTRSRSGREPAVWEFRDVLAA
jgi:hypothetical protein